MIIDKGKEKKWTEIPRTGAVSAFTTKDVLKVLRTVEKEDSGCQGSERCLNRNQI